MQSPIEILQEVVRRLEGAHLDYFLVGSLAAMVYGRPRFTNDVDLVVRIKPSEVREFEKLFATDEFYCPPFETLQDEVLREGMFNLIHQSSGVKIDVVIPKKTAFYESEFDRRKKVELLPGFEAFVASPEDIILKKLDFYREGESEKHLVDIRSILSETSIDRTYLLEWIGRLGLQATWEKVE